MGVIGKLLDLLLGPKNAQPSVIKDQFFPPEWLQCPLCGSRDRFYLTMQFEFAVRDGGMEYATKNPTPNDVKRCVCDTCRHEGSYSEFLPQHDLDK